METPMNEIEERNRISEELKNTTQLSQEQLDKLAITMDHFLHALPKVHPCSFFCYPQVQPSAKREGFATIPNTTWDDIGALDKPTYIVFNKIDAYQFVERSEYDIDVEKRENISLERLEKMWFSKGTPCIFISAKEKINIENLKTNLYNIVLEIHSGRYPFNNLLY